MWTNIEAASVGGGACKGPSTLVLKKFAKDGNVRNCVFLE